MRLVEPILLLAGGGVVFIFFIGSSDAQDELHRLLRQAFQSGECHARPSV